VAVQADCWVQEALLRLRTHAPAADEPLSQVARREVTRAFALFRLVNRTGP
jgi:hypothetical protein